MDSDFTITVTGPGVNVSKTVDSQTALRALRILWGEAGEMRSTGNESPGAPGEVSLTIGEFLSESRAGNNPEKIAAIALYLQDHLSQRRLKKEDVLDWFARAGEPPPKNPTRDLQSAIERRLIAEDHNRRGEYFVTKTGINAVKGKLTPTKAKAHPRLSGRTIGDPSEEDVSPGGSPTTRRRATRKKVGSSGGPIGQVRALIAEGWFETPRTMKVLLDELAARGSHYEDTNLTDPMQALVKGQELRRKKGIPSGGKREVWHYSKW